MIRYILDGHNFIHRIPKYLKLLDHDYVNCLKILYNDIFNYADIRQVTILLVFDGNPPWFPDHRLPNLKVKFSGSHREADNDIIAMAEEWSGRQTIIVTEDRKVLRSVIALGCQTMSPSEFNRLIQDKRKKKILNSLYLEGKKERLSRTEVEWWKKEMDRALAEKQKKEK